MDEYIVEFPFSIPDVLCDEIISFFESEQGRYQGCTLGGLNKSIKDTTDYIIPTTINNNIKNKTSKNDWTKIEKFLCKELQDKLKIYIDRISKKNYQPENNNNIEFNFFDNNKIHAENFMVQKYIKNEGKYIYHNDGYVDYDKKKHRVITFLWYLNTVEEGGQTEMWENIFVKPEKGKLLLFPASWCFPHRGRMPISSDKYIITGWLYLSDNGFDMAVDEVKESQVMSCLSNQTHTPCQTHSGAKHPTELVVDKLPGKFEVFTEASSCYTGGEKQELFIESNGLMPMHYEVPKKYVTNKTKCNFMVVDNFYDNPDVVRDFALTLQYSEHDFHPGKRTKTFANEIHKQKFGHLLKNVAGKIINFATVDNQINESENGVFQYYTLVDWLGIHKDSYNTNWAGIIYLTPNAPFSSGTGIFELIDGDYANAEKYGKDITKWKLVNNVGNVYNRLFLFRSDQYHMAMEFFGSNIENGRLIQVFFFSTEY